MKRSKLFLSVSTVVLAVAAFAAGKARHHITACTAGKTNVGVVSCATTAGVPIGSATCRTTVVNTATLYKIGRASCRERV